MAKDKDEQKKFVPNDYENILLKESLSCIWWEYAVEHMKCQMDVKY